LTLSNEDIVSLLNDYDKETKAIKKDALKLSWYMRGGLTYDDIMILSTTEREWIGDIIKDNLETTKKSGMPFF
jgi:hypothetical protein